MTPFLNTEIEQYKEKKFIEYPENIPVYIENNLSPKFEIRPYQDEALKNFIIYMEDKRISGEKQTHLLFRMATGSGKTFCMAATILYLFRKGYSNFLFFVDDVNIIEKTKINFKDIYSQKYLFAKDIIIDGKKVEINEVDNFKDSMEEAINIKFTTIQKLSSDLKKNRENSMTKKDFSRIKVAIISDEAHHMNAETKKRRDENLNSDESDNLKSWEEAGEFVFKSNRNNVLLEFTATIDLSNNENLSSKYKDKIIFDYPLLKFREDKYTKEFFSVQVDTTPLQRTLLAILMSQYRMKLFADLKKDVKPVILLKHSRTNLADLFFKELNNFLEHELSIKDILKLRETKNENILKMFKYYEEHNLLNENLVYELKQAFSKEKTILLHNKIPNKEKENNILQVNSLEDKNNPIRLIVTVEMLHEGWDVLNLFDIVRLYDERQSSGKKLSPATIQEAQLIGRGVRYYPFTIDNDNEFKHKRKWDYETDNVYRICETLLYYSQSDNRYISELRQALRETGFDTDNKVQFSYDVKYGFEMSPLYKYGKLFENRKVKIQKKEVNGIPESFNTDIFYRVSDSNINILGLMDDTSIKDSLSSERESRRYKIHQIEKRIVYRALQKYNVFRFNTLINYFPNLKSMEEFVSSKNYYGNHEVEIFKIGNIDNEDLYQGVLMSLEKLSNNILNMKDQYEGSNEFYEIPLKNVVKNQTRFKINPDRFGEGISQNSQVLPEELQMDLSEKDWFVFNDHYGTTEEKRFVKYFDSMYSKLSEKYDEVYLIRNERKLKLYSFKNGNRFEPDFLLLLQKHKNSKVEEQHIFIEPKGEIYRYNDKWKEEFLLELESNSKVISYVDNDEYKIIGLPFYTHNSGIEDFKVEFKNKTIDNS